MIVGALVAGAAKSAEDVANTGVKDGYETLKSLLKKFFAGRPAAEMVLAEHESDPSTYQAPLEKHINETGAFRDSDVLEAARSLLELVGPHAASSRHYTAGVIKADRGGVAASHIEGGVHSGYRPIGGESVDPS